MTLATFLMKLFITKICWVLQGNSKGERCFYCQYAESIQSWIIHYVRMHGACFTYGYDYKKTAPQIISNCCTGLFTVVNNLVTS